MLNFEKFQTIDITNTVKFMLKHGKNQWNDISENSLKSQLQAIQNSESFGLEAKVNGKTAGILLTSSPAKFSKYYPHTVNPIKIGHISEVVIDASFKGQGIGTKILEKAKEIFNESGIQIVFAERHEENIGSAKVMERSGFTLVDTFLDFPRRKTGSKCTCVCQFTFISSK